MGTNSGLRWRKEKYNAQEVSLKSIVKVGPPGTERLNKIKVYFEKLHKRFRDTHSLTF